MERTGSEVEMDALAQAWTALQEYLASRCKALNEEVSRYPTPIAHCDDQLPKLIEQRGRAVQELRRMTDLGPVPSVTDARGWRRDLEAFLADPDFATDDDAGAALRSRVRVSLRAFAAQNVSAPSIE